MKPALLLLTLYLLLPLAQAEGNAVVGLIVEGDMELADGSIVNASIVETSGSFFGLTAIVLNQSIQERDPSVRDVVLQSRVDRSRVLATLGLQERAVDESSPIFAVFSLRDHQPPPGVQAVRVEHGRNDFFMLESEIGRDTVHLFWVEPEDHAHWVEIIRIAVSIEWIQEAYAEGNLRWLQRHLDRITPVRTWDATSESRLADLAALSDLRELVVTSRHHVRDRRPNDLQVAYIQEVNEVLIARHDRRAEEYDARYQSLLDAIDREAFRIQDDAFLALSREQAAAAAKQATWTFGQLWVAIILGAIGIALQIRRLLTARHGRLRRASPYPNPHASRAVPRTPEVTFTVVEGQGDAAGASPALD